MPELGYAHFIEWSEWPATDEDMEKAKARVLRSFKASASARRLRRVGELTWVIRRLDGFPGDRNGTIGVKAECQTIERAQK